TMVDQLNGFAAEVTRVAREVGTEGKLGGQAQVPGVAGTWKDLTDNVNSMATNLTAQVRGIAKVVTAVANGDLHKKLTVEAKGEIAAKAARARVPVMINGKPGTGKEVFARAIHSASPRARGQLVMVDCSAVSPGLIGSGLFGHERGAFPGAFDRQVGRLVQADGGSIIIDDVECIPLETQAKLVEFLNTGEVQMIGGSIRQSVD